MSNARIRYKIKLYAQAIKDKYPLKMVILQKSYPHEEFKKDREIEVAVVVEGLKDDMLETKYDLEQLAKQIDPFIDPVLIEKDKTDPTGFFASIQKTGEIIYHGE